MAPLEKSQPDAFPRPRPATAPSAARRTQRERARQANAVGRRLRSELKALLATCPGSRQTSASLAQWLSVSRPVCHRLFAAVQVEGDGLEVLAALPGVDALRQIARAAEARGVSRRIIAATLGAIDHYHDLVGLAGGSQAKLLAQLERLRQDLSARSASAAAALLERRGLHDAAARVMGIKCQTHMVVYVLLPGRFGPAAHEHQPGASAPDMLAALNVQAWLGVRARAGHFPLVATRTSDLPTNQSHPTTLELSNAEGFTPGAILGEFSTLPLPAIHSSRIGRHLHQQIDMTMPRALRSREARDVVMGNRFYVSPPTPRTPQEHTELADSTELTQQVSVMPRIPATNLILDVLVHKELAPIKLDCRGVYYPGHEGLVVDDADKRWADRLGDGPRSSPIATGAAPAGIDLDYGRVLSTLAEHAGVAASELVTFRMEMEYPLQGWQHLAELVLQR